MHVASPPPAGTTPVTPQEDGLIESLATTFVVEDRHRSVNVGSDEASQIDRHCSVVCSKRTGPPSPSRSDYRVGQEAPHLDVKSLQRVNLFRWANTRMLRGFFSG